MKHRQTAGSSVASTGALTPVARPGRETFAEPVIAAGLVLLSCSDARVCALGGEDLDQRWTFALDRPTFRGPVVAGPHVFTAGRSVLHALHLESGEEVWRFDANTTVETPRVIADGLVAAGDGTGTVHAFAAADGTPAWTFPTGAAEASLSPVTTAGLVFVDGDKRLHALDAATGAERWNFRPRVEQGESLPDFLSVEAASPNLVAVVGQGGRMYVLDTATGIERRRFRAGRTLYLWPHIVNGRLYARTDDRGLPAYAIDIESGHEAWQFAEPASAWQSLTVAHDTAYLGGTDNGLYAVRA